MPPSRRPLKSGCPTHHHRKSLGMFRRYFWRPRGIVCRDCRRTLVKDPVRWRARVKVPWWRMRGFWRKRSKAYRLGVYVGAILMFFAGMVIMAAMSPSTTSPPVCAARFVCVPHR